MSALREFCLKYLLRKEEDEMAVVYATLIIKGKKTIDQVPPPVCASRSRRFWKPARWRSDAASGAVYPPRFAITRGRKMPNGRSHHTSGT